MHSCSSEESISVEIFLITWYSSCIKKNKCNLFADHILFWIAALNGQPVFSDMLYILLV